MERPQPCGCLEGQGKEPPGRGKGELTETQEAQGARGPPPLELSEEDGVYEEGYFQATAPPTHPPALFWPVAPSNALFAQTPSPSPGAVRTSGCPQARHPRLKPQPPWQHLPDPPSSRTRPAPRLQLCVWQSPPPPRARPPPASAQARCHREAAHAPSRVPGSPVPPGARPLGGRQGGRGVGAILSRRAPREVTGAVTLCFLERTCAPAAFPRAPLSNLITAGRWHWTL